MKRKTFRPKKHLGQNFLYDPAIAKRIVDAAALPAGQLVVELGAGKGIMTRQIAATGAHVVAIEIDTALSKSLAAEFETPDGDSSISPEVLNLDLTKVSLAELLEARETKRCVLMGNIPYYLTRDVLFTFLVDEYEMIESAYLMMQREVGERIVSKSGSRVYGITSVILQCLYDVKSLFKVQPGSFHPKPKVTSIVLEFRRKPEALVSMSELKHFTMVVKNLFQQRRKTIRNTLKAFYSLSDPELETVHTKTSIGLDRRPEELCKEEFVELSRALAGMQAQNGGAR